MPSPAIIDVLRRYWGFEALRPLQEQAIEAGLSKRDSLVIMPTGGGKSLCYQVPPVVAGRTDIVVSPLISLMNDQVNGLRAAGYPAAALHSGLSIDDRNVVFEGMRAGAYRLVFVSPERLLAGGFAPTVRQLGVQSFAIDEAHCISHWGHDFRPEYRQLAELRDRFGDVSLHAFTATATPRVQADIVGQLGLRDPNVLVGASDRPNLTYRVVPRVSVADQLAEIIARHAGEAVIVYCMTRRETEALAASLSGGGINAAPYHAGLTPTVRHRTQESFARETLDVVVATVAFGMGIDRSNVRCVVHANMPKSIEHYQQETGRAGRDGLEAECVLLYSAADVLRWKGLLERSAAEADEQDGEALAAQVELLEHMQGYCGTLQCRHRTLARYFGQSYERDNCEACDVCLDEVDAMPDSTTVARKILSCVARLGQRWGVGQVVSVLRGADNEQVRRHRHEQVSTYGLLAKVPEKSLTNLVYQLVDQQLLERTPGDRPVLRLTSEGVEAMKGERDVLLVEPRARRLRRARSAVDSWEGVDRELFEALRRRRREIAAERGVPPYVVFGDETLREMARQRPSSAAALRGVRGVGERKLADLGPAFLEVINEHCAARHLDQDVDVQITAAPAPGAKRSSPTRARALEMFAEGASIEAVIEATGRAPRTVTGYLADHLREHPEQLETWVGREVHDRVTAAMGAVRTTRLKPIFEHLGGAVAYEAIQLVVACRTADGDASAR